jgi:hypothetical protein|tara:strand:- start:57 stop:509 length:453 start_codon:yes stop_codon:yes gene_type:complete
MAVVRGEQGAVRFAAAGTVAATDAAIVGTRSWTLNITKETIDATKQGDTFRSFVGSMISGSGTVELVFDRSQSSQLTFLEDVLTTSDPADAAFELFTDSDGIDGTSIASDTDAFKFNGIITSADVGSTTGDLVVATCNFVTSGTITSKLD